MVSAITIGIINKNKDFKYIRPRNSSNLFVDQLETLVDQSFATAVWLILYSIIVIIWKVVYSVLPVISIHSNVLQRYSVVLTITVRIIISCPNIITYIVGSLHYFHLSTTGCCILLCCSDLFSSLIICQYCVC